MVKKNALKKANKIPYEIRPEMFYASYLANKKNPLRLIWIAAHWEKKVSKNQVFQTDIKTIVNEICRNKVAISLKISGHLMYGVVRIFSRKVKYLLTECNEALSAIRFGLMPKDSIDLVSSVGKKETVTMEQTFGLLEEEFNIDFLTGMSIAFNLDLTAHQCRREDITLKEPNCPMISSFMVEDNFGFGDMGELLEDLQTLPLIMEESTFHQALHESSNKITANPVEDTYVPDMQLDEVLNQTKTSKRKSQEANNENDIGKGKRVKISDNVEVIGTECGQPEDLLVDRGLDLLLAKNITINPDEAIKSKKKRKLIIDPTMVISKAAMKRHLSDTTITLLAGIELAPPTKKIMMISESSRIPQILRHPSQHFIHPILTQMLERNMVITPKDDHDIPDIEIVRRDVQNGKEGNISVLNISIENDELQNVALMNNLPVLDDALQDSNGLVLNQPEQITDGPWNDQSDLTSEEASKERKGKKRSNNSNVNVDLIGSKENIPELPEMPPELFTSPKPHCCRFNVFDPFSPLENTIRVRDVISMPIKPKEATADLKHRFIKFLRNILHRSEASFNSAMEDLSVQNRQEVSFLFYTLLEMKKDGYIDVAQAESFSHIQLSRGPKFKNLSSSKA